MDERNLFFKRLDDLISLSSKRGLAKSSFLTLEEKALAEKYLQNKIGNDSFFFYGGAEGAERTVAVIGEYAQKEDAEICCVKVNLPSYKEQSEREIGVRDILGAILALGIKKDAVGDIAKCENGFLCFVKSSVAPLILESLSKAGRIAVKSEITELQSDYIIEHPLQEESVVCASLRADCLVGAICNLSREDAKALILRGDFSRNHEQMNRPDTQLKCDDVLSIRHFGRFLLGNIIGQTKSDRLRVTVFRYI